MKGKFDRLIDRLPGWPSERQWVTIGAFFLVLYMLDMARRNADLWNVEVFKVIIQAVSITGLLNMIFAFHFAANKTDEAKTNNTAKAFDAITATAKQSAHPEPDFVLEPGETAQASTKE